MKQFVMLSLFTRKRLTQLVVGLCLLTAVLHAPSNAAAFSGQPGQLAQTIPTITPPGGPPTEVPPPTDVPPPPPEPGTPIPPPTNTPIVATPTNTPAVSGPTATNTPAGSFATAEPCGEPPTIRVSGELTVRQGPGNDYPVLSTLQNGAVRPIIGRAEQAQYWQIELADGRAGWVLDQAVTVNGYTGNVALATPPPINGNTPTPASGAPWQPTPNPGCVTATPTATATATTAPTSTPTATTAADEQATAASAAASAETAAEAAAEAVAEATAERVTATAAAQATATTVSATMTAVAVGANDAPAAAPLPNESGSGANWILIAGIVLILLGGGYAVVGRLRGG